MQQQNLVINLNLNYLRLVACPSEKHGNSEMKYWKKMKYWNQKLPVILGAKFNTFIKTFCDNTCCCPYEDQWVWRILILLDLHEYNNGTCTNLNWKHSMSIVTFGVLITYLFWVCWQVLIFTWSRPQLVWRELIQYPLLTWHVPPCQITVTVAMFSLKIIQFSDEPEGACLSLQTARVTQRRPHCLPLFWQGQLKCTFQWWCSASPFHREDHGAALVRLPSMPGIFPGPMKIISKLHGITCGPDLMVPFTSGEVGRGSEVAWHKMTRTRTNRCGLVFDKLCNAWSEKGVFS